MSKRYDIILQKIENMDKENLKECVVKLTRENCGLRQRIKNLEYRLLQRNESMHGEVFDRDFRKREK